MLIDKVGLSARYILVSLCVVVATACSDAQSPTAPTTLSPFRGTAPNPTPIPTPDLAPTVEALVRAALLDILKEIPTPKPTYWPTIEDYSLGISQAYRDAGISPNPGALLDAGLSRYDQFSSVYVAQTCVSGAELASKEFRSFVAQTVGRRTPDGISAIGVAAKDLIAEMVARAAEGTETSCMMPFLYPETGAELVVALGLTKAYIARNARGVGRELLESASEGYDRRSFLEGEPFLEKYCGEDIDCRASVTPEEDLERRRKALRDAGLSDEYISSLPAFRQTAPAAPAVAAPAVPPPLDWGRLRPRARLIRDRPIVAGLET